MAPLSNTGARHAEARRPARARPPGTGCRIDPALALQPPDLHHRQGPDHRHRPRLVLCRRRRGARAHDRALDGDHAQLLRRGPQARLLPVDGIPHGPQHDQRHAQHVRREGVPRRADGAGRDGPAPGEHRRHGAGCGAGQRRPRPAGGLLSRFDGDHGHRRLRLWHPLRIRHVPPGHRGGPAGRAPRQLAALWQPLGVPAPRGALPGQVPRPRGRVRRRARQEDLPVGRDRRRDGHGLRLPDPRLRHRHGEQHAAVGGQGQPRLRPQVLQRGQLHPRRRGQERFREPLQGALPGRHHRNGARAAPEAAVLLRQRFAAGHALPLRQDRVALRGAARQGGDPAQRHPSLDRRGRADAHPGRPAPSRLGAGPGRS
jgi:hypothetical protein